MSPATLRVLETLGSSPGPIWGLHIIRETGLPSGSVYPILARLEAVGMVTSEWETEPSRPGARRRIYRLTPTSSESIELAPRLLSEPQARKVVSPKKGQPGLANN